MDFKERLDSIYNDVVQPLENYSGKKSNTVTGMIEYMTVLGDVATDFAEKMNKEHQSLIESNPELKEDIESYILSLKNKMVETYKPK
ncbi:MAG: hypothetical protein KDF60_19795 [Calditrichaeota bacterium]|nr:hypothetical protein [Calditrichota bacterium]